jgi:hypothetical protein
MTGVGFAADENAELSTTRDTSPIYAASRRWPAAVVMVGAVLMDMIDVTIVNVALPTSGTSAP